MGALSFGLSHSKRDNGRGWPSLSYINLANHTKPLQPQGLFISSVTPISQQISLQYLVYRVLSVDLIAGHLKARSLSSVRAKVPRLV